MDEANRNTMNATDSKMDNVVHFDSEVANVGNFEVEPSLESVASNIAKVDEMFPFLGEYEFNRELSMLSSDIQTSATAMLSAGCRLLRLKEHEAHGQFMKAIEKVGINQRMANRFMSCALRFIEADTGKLKYPQLVQQNTSKIYELAMLDDDDLKLLDEGGSVADITLDDVDKLSVRELRKKLREAKEEKKALEGVINSKNEKLDEMEKRMLLGDKKTVDYPDVSELNSRIDALPVDSFRLARTIEGMADEFKDLTTGDETADGAYRIAFERLRSTARAIVEELERAVDYADSIIPECVRMNTGFNFANAKDVEVTEL